MRQKHFLWCPNCNDLYPIPAGEDFSLPGVRDQAASEASTTASGRFATRHHHHKLERLQGIGERCTLGNSPVDFARVEYIEVTNGHDWYVVRSALKGGAGPASYHLFPGRLSGLPIRMLPTPPSPVVP